MIEFISEHQLNIMLAMSSVCATIAAFALFTKALPKKRKLIILLMELSAVSLLSFDRLAYMYSGDVSRTGYIMVRVSNFLVFSLTLVVVLALNLYLIDLLLNEGQLPEIPARLKIVTALVVIGILLVVLSQFNGLYYTFDEFNKYHRSPGFIICYLFPVLCPFIQLTVIVQYRKVLNRGILTSLMLFIIIPLIASIIQIFTYGLSLTNMSVVGVAVCLYVFVLIDINKKIERAQKLEIDFWREEQKNMKELFEQTVTAFVNATDEKDAYMSGRSVRVAGYAKKIAIACGKNDKECDEIYYAALLHDIGRLGIPDSILTKEDLTKEEKEILKQKPEIGDRILSGIKAMPYLRNGALYVNEQYNGGGYPEGLKGDAIPEIARIIAVAKYYDDITTAKKDRAPYPQFIVREEFIKGAGNRFDPRFASIMVNIIDSDPTYDMKVDGDIREIKPDEDLHCNKYRSRISKGILVEPYLTHIYIKCRPEDVPEGGFSTPSIIMFDSYDSFVHDDERTIKAFNYCEYGEIWFDGHMVCTSARNMEMNVSDNASDDADKKNDDSYEIITGRYDDHVKVKIVGPKKTVDVILALSNSSKYAYVGLTGEHCYIHDIRIEKTGEAVKEGDIPRISGEVIFTDRMEGDLPNIQIDMNRSAHTEGILLQDGMKIMMHTLSLPSANLVWHCPYIVLYDSDDGTVGGENYREYALIKMNGETNSKTDYSDNSIDIEKDERFTDWENWLEKNRKGLECEIDFSIKGKNIITVAENAGITLKNVTVLKNPVREIYVALTGDQCAMTDIRIKL